MASTRDRLSRLLQLRHELDANRPEHRLASIDAEIAALEAELGVTEAADKVGQRPGAEAAAAEHHARIAAAVRELGGLLDTWQPIIGRVPDSGGQASRWPVQVGLVRAVRTQLRSWRVKRPEVLGLPPRDRHAENVADALDAVARAEARLAHAKILPDDAREKATRDATADVAQAKRRLAELDA